MNKVNCVMLKSFLINIVLSILKLVFGLLVNSMALVADGVHSFSDLITDIIAIVGNKLSSIPADDKHPYGHGKLEYVTSIFIGIVICGLGGSLIWNAFSSESKSLEMIVVYVSVFTITAKFILSRYILKQGKLLKNNILISSGKESSMDVISSIVVLLSALLMYFQKYNDIFSYSDVVAAILIGIFIIKTGYCILAENLSIILGEQESDLEYINSIKKVILKFELVKNIDNLILIKYGSYYELNCEISMDCHISIKDAHDAIELIEKKLNKFDKRIKYKNIHVNPYENI